MAEESDLPTEVETVDFVRVASSENGEVMEFPTEEDNTVIFSAIKTQFPMAVGLKYRSESGAWRAVRDVNGNLVAPKEGWGNQLYIISVPETPVGENSETRKRKTESETNGSSTKSKKLNNDERRLKTDLPVTNLPYKCTSKELKEYFEKNYGTVEMCKIKTDPKTNQSRGFGFVRFRDVDTAREAVNNTHTLHGRVFSVKLKSETPFKLFVGNLHKESTQGEIKKYFETHGDILEVVIPKNSRNFFCFVTYAQKHDAIKVLKMEHKLRGRKLNLAEAQNNNQGGAYGNHLHAMGHNRGGFHEGYGVYPPQPSLYNNSLYNNQKMSGPYGEGGSARGSHVGDHYGDRAMKEGLQSMLYNYFGGGNY